MKEYLPYIVSIIVAAISGFASYAAARRTSKTDLQTVKENNKHDLEKLMEQHKLDLEALEQKHQMEIDKLNIEHEHQMELQQKGFENQFGSMIIQEALKIPAVQQQISAEMRNSAGKRSSKSH